jgi:hypothetical protein
MGDFFDVPRATVRAGDGSCELPILYRDASQLGVFIPIELERASAHLAGRSIEPWPVLGRAVAMVFAWEYRDSTVGSYGELGLGILARRIGSHPSLARFAVDTGAQDDQGTWVVTLPVTSEAAYDAGVEIWGYPKYVSPIRTRFLHDRAEAVLGDELALSIGVLHGPELAGQAIATYTAREGRLLRTRIEVDHAVRWGGGGSVKLDVFGDGPTARAMRELGVDRGRATAAFRVDGFRARLPAGVDLGPIAA